jgi:hypothetical protein
VNREPALGSSRARPRSHPSSRIFMNKQQPRILTVPAGVEVCVFVTVPTSLDRTRFRTGTSFPTNNLNLIDPCPPCPSNLGTTTTPRLRSRRPSPPRRDLADPHPPRSGPTNLQPPPSSSRARSVALEAGRHRQRRPHLHGVRPVGLASPPPLLREHPSRLSNNCDLVHPSLTGSQQFPATRAPCVGPAGRAGKASRSDDW